MKPSITVNKQRETNRLKWFNHRVFFIVSGLLATILVWQILSMIFPRIIIASPASTFVSLVNLATNGSLWRQLGYSLVRLLIGLGIGSLAGIALGVIAGLNRRIQLFLEPMRWVAMTVPAIIITVLALLWFGIGSAPVIFMTAVITVPITYVNTLEGMLAIDARIIEMSAVYRIPAGMRLREIYLPGIGSAIMAGLTLASGVGVRALILAEFMGARNGVGHSLFIAWTFLDTPALFAWILVAFGLLGLVEFGVLRPVRDYLTRWKKT
ncbi:MAG: ABC transporter permease [Dehalococcoidales bacterium]|jgi:NitT/TauT family transport system permease protein|nr:ABC transporter permease [Dehalococcoidales bacterium]